MPGTSYLVPSFAVHWGLVIRHSLFHLRYFPDVPVKKVRFVLSLWEEDMKKEGHELRVIGSTHYNTDQLVEIGIQLLVSNILTYKGKALVDGFGDYHKLFWNCQTFAKIFLSKICNNPNAEFPHFTSSEVTQLVRHPHSVIIP